MSFVAPLFLAGLAALAMPWLLHRFSHEDPEQQAFPSTRFLEAVPPPVSRRRRLRYKALLALRWLALALLCLVFARPFFNNNDSDANAPALQVIVIDRSLSMQVDDRFDRAVDAAQDILSSAGSADQVRVFAADDRFIELTEGEVSADSARAELSGLVASDGRLDVGVATRRIDAVASETRLPVVAHLITDAQQSALPIRRNELFAPAVREFQIINVGESAPENAGLSALASTLDEANAQVVVSAAAFGSDSPVTRDIVISHDGRELMRDTVVMNVGVPVERVYDNLPLPAVASPQLNVAFEQGDALPADDSVRIGITRDSARRVVVAGFGTRVPDTPGVFVRTALQSGAEARVEDIAADSNSLPEDARHAVIFADPGDDVAMARVLRQTDRGVNVLLIPVMATEPEDYATEASVARVDDAHPMSLDDLDWFDVRFYSGVSFSEQDEDLKLMETSAGNALLVDRSGPSGRLLILNDPLDGQISNLPFEPAFVDLVGRMLDWLDAVDAIPRRAVVGDKLVVPVRAQVFDPDDNALVGLGDASGVSAVDLQHRGSYRVVDSRGERFVQVNVDPRETDLAPISETDLEAWQGRYEQATSTDNTAAGAAAEDAQGDVSQAGASRQAEPHYRPLWQWLLIAALALVLLESVVANRRLAVRRDGS